MKQNVLKKILIEAQQSNSLCVFDIDSTLIKVSGRTQAILRKAPSDPMVKDSCASYKEFFESLIVSEKDFSLKDILKKGGIYLDFNGHKQVYFFWTKNFFSHRFLKHDQLYEGVPSYLNQLKDQGTEIMYLTGRSQKEMEEGTYKQLTQFKLPLKSKKHLIMKENMYTEDSYFKKNQLEKLLKKYSNIWFFENEPSIINFVHEYLPQIKIVFMKSVHSGRQKLRKKFLEISEFNL